MYHKKLKNFCISASMFIRIKKEFVLLMVCQKVTVLTDLKKQLYIIYSRILYLSNSFGKRKGTQLLVIMEKNANLFIWNVADVISS